MLWHSTTSWHIRRYAHRLFVLQFLSVLFDLILGIRKLLTAVDDLIVIRFAPCAFMVLAFFTDFLIIWLDLELIRDIWFIVKHTINARRDYVICAEKFELIISTHTPHARRDMQTVYLTAYRKVFQLTRLMRGVTEVKDRIKHAFKISTHTPHARRDGSSSGRPLSNPNFNSHASCEAWRSAVDTTSRPTTLSTHTPHARRDRRVRRGVSAEAISTHTPHARRDRIATARRQLLPISTHTPHARRDGSEQLIVAAAIVFQLTRLMRGVTRSRKEYRR